MLIDPGGENADIAWEIGLTIWGIWVEKPKRLAYVIQPLARDRPIRDFIMDSLRAHIVDVLQIWPSTHKFLHTGKLTGLKNNIPDAALTDAQIFPARRVDSVHDHAGHAAHARVALAPCLTLDQAGQKLAV